MHKLGREVLGVKWTSQIMSPQIIEKVSSSVVPLIKAVALKQ